MAKAVKKEGSASPQGDAKTSSKTSSKGSLLLPLLSVAVVVAAVAWSQWTDEHAALVRQLGARLESLTAAGELPNKYATDMVTVNVRQLVSAAACEDDAFQPAVLSRSDELVHVTDAMAAGVSPDKVFFMLNGRNQGAYVSYNGQFECIAKAAELAARWLGADRDVMANGVRLYSQMGMPVRNARELAETKNLVHVLLDFQLWQWPGIKRGHRYVLEDGVALTMIGESPKVFDVEFFLTQAEADKIIELAEPKLDRSKVDGSNSSKVVSKSRTSHTAFLDDSDFTRDFRRRSSRLARLASPSYTERMQLVRYAAGEFYRQHFDTFHSRDFLPKGTGLPVFDDYKTWANWAAETIRGLDQEIVPETFRPGGALFPDAEDEEFFPNALLDLFYTSANESNLFSALFDKKWPKWIRENVDNNVPVLMPQLLEKGAKPEYLEFIIRAWEKKIGLGELRYTFPKPPVNSVSHFFNWVRWAKERVTFLGDDCPRIARPTGKLYPKYTVGFQETLLEFILDDYSRDFIVRITNADWYDWMVVNRGRNHVLFKVLQVFPQFAELAIRTWESHVGSQLLHYNMPKYVKDFHPQRYVTLFLYLNNQTKIGGETVFPFSLDRYSNEDIVRTGMDECSTGLAVPPLGLHASLFYVQTPEGDPDVMSRHGGCPPHEGVKWGANSFMWDSDADEGADLWTTK